MATWPIAELSGLIDPDIFVTGYTPTGPDVGAEVAQVLNKLNTTIEGANELKTGLDAADTTNDAQDATLAAYAILIQDALNDSSNNAADIIPLQSHVAGDGSDHADVATHTLEIAALQSEIGLGHAEITGDVADFDFAVYGGYNQFILNKDASIQTVTLTSPASTSWPEGRQCTFFCDATYGALISSAYLNPGYGTGHEDIFLKRGDVLRLTVVDVTTGQRWMATKDVAPVSETVFKELTATESYSLARDLPFKLFIVSGQAGGELATVTLPEITSDMVGTELKGFLHGSTGDGLKFLYSGTDQILDLDGGTGDFIIADGSTAKSIITLTALPAVGGVYYWGASLVGATS